MYLPKDFTILVADRNSHIRELIRREMTAEGYRVWLARNGREVIQWAYEHASFDLLILDPDLPDMDGSVLFKMLHSRIPSLPIVIHAFGSDYANHQLFLKATTFVEKGANSIEILKTVACQILKRPDQQQTNVQKDGDLQHKGS